MISSINELKKYKKLLYSSNRSNLIEKAKTFSIILDRWEKYSDPYLSDIVLLSDISEAFIKEASNMYKITKDEKYKVQVTAARELVLKNWAPKKEVRDYLSDILKNKKDLTFNDVKLALRQSHLWNKTRPSTVVSILKELQLSSVKD